MSRVVIPDPGLVDVYEEMAETFVSALLRFCDEMEEICKAHGYKPMVDFTNRIQQFYLEDFRNHVIRCYENWESGGASLPALARAINAGDDAIYTTEQQMSQLRDRIEGMFSRTFAPIQVDVSSPGLDEHDIEKVGEQLRRFKSGIDYGMEKAVYTINARAEDNILYNYIAPVIQNTGDSLRDALDSMMKQATVGEDAYIEGIVRSWGDITPGPQMDTDDVVKWPDDVVFY